MCAALRLPTCRRQFPRDIGAERPCLNFHMGRCDGFCRPEMTAEEYNRRIEQAVLLLEGKSKQLLREMTALNVRKRGVAVVENGSWAPAAGKEMTTLLAGMTEMELLAPPLTLKSAPKNGQREALDALADRVADGVLAARERL